MQEERRNSGSPSASTGENTAMTEAIDDKVAEGAEAAENERNSKKPNKKKAAPKKKSLLKGKNRGDTPTEKEAAPRKRRKLTPRQAFLRLLIKIGVVVAATIIMVTVVGGVFICHSNDMYPAVRDGDLIITFRLGTIRTGDIIAYAYEGKTLFGRVVGEPGDEIYIDADGNFTVNGTSPYETIFYETRAREMSPVTYPFAVQEGSYFVLADEREDGFDSRAAGPVTKTKGKVVLILRRRGF